MRRAGLKSAGIAAFLVFAAIFAYFPVLKFSFTNWDDPIWVTHNLFIRHLDPMSFKWMFFGAWLGTWTPVTWLSLSLDYRLDGLDPFVYHLHNLILHSTVTVLFYLVLRRLGALLTPPPAKGMPLPGEHPVRSAAWMAALLFAVHPLHAETVAWVSDRIDLLCAVFYLASVLCHLYAPPHGGDKHCGTASYTFLCLALASKPTAVSLPFVLALLDQWILRKPWGSYWDQLTQKAGALVPAGLIALLTLVTRSGAQDLRSLQAVPLDYRVMNACQSLWFYAVKTLAPVGLCPVIPMFRDRTFSTPYLSAALGCVLVAAAAFYFRDKKPYLAVAPALYGVMLLPTLGLVGSGSQAAADRYTYLPGMVLFLSAALGLRQVFGRFRIFLTVAVLALAVVLVWATRAQASYWKDSRSLWGQELRLYPVNYASAYSGLAEAYLEEGNPGNALSLYDMGAKASPGMAYLYNGKAGALLALGRDAEAVAACQDALARSAPLDEQSGWSHAIQDILDTRSGKREGADTERSQALLSAPGNAFLHFDLGEKYSEHSMLDAALAQYQTAI